MEALAAAGINTDGAEGVDLSRSHDVRLFLLPSGMAYVVKRQRKGTWEKGRELAAELLVYRLAGWTDALADALPQSILVDERREVLVLLAAGRSPLAPTPSLAGSLGKLTAGWHRATAGLPLPATASAGILHLPTTDPDDWGLRALAARRLGERIAADLVLSELLAAGAAAWHPECLVHGDLKWDNCLVEADRVRVIDWELSGLGDPAWDVSCVIAEQLALHPETGPGESPVASAFMGSYRCPADDFMRRCALFTIARLAHLALEQVEYVGEAQIAAPTLELARRLAAEVDALSLRLAGEAR
jgi:Ser/Thr protein kinase RdoA (MazF antagonist)